MRKKSEKDLVVPKNAQSFFEHRRKTGFGGLVGFKNLVELLKNESRKIKGEDIVEYSLEQMRESALVAFDKKISVEIVEKIAYSYGYYFYYFLNSEQSPLSVEESKSVCFYRVLKNIKRVSDLLEIDTNVCRKHLKKGVQVLLLDSTFSSFVLWVENKSKKNSLEEGSLLASAPILNLKQYLPKSLVFTLSTKGQTLTEVFENNSMQELSKLKGMGKGKIQLLTSFIEHNDLLHLIQ